VFRVERAQALGMTTPGRFWEARSHDDLVAVLFAKWLEPSDEVVALLFTSTGEVSTRQHVAYRLHLRNADGDSLMEQQMYYDVVGGRISWARVMCSGFVRVQPQSSGSEPTIDR
jgi:hypothetical protein